MSRPALAVVAISFLALVGCSLTPAGTSPTPINPPSPTQPSIPPTSAPTPTPAATPTMGPTPTPTAAFYLRGWYTQAIPPKYTFGWLPPVTIADGLYINDNVAVPAIFPGPLMIVPVSRTISDTGIKAIEDETGALGLLDGSGDFTGGRPMPGAKLAQLQLVIDGKTYDLVGNPDLAVLCDRGRCTAETGTPEAFTAFWNELGMLDLWLADDLGSSSQYAPERVALLLTTLDGVDTMSPAPSVVPWPLDTPLASTGSSYPGDSSSRCLTLSGTDLATMLPILQSATQLTVFRDGAGTLAQPTARVLVPQEPSPCGSGL